MSILERYLSLVQRIAGREPLENHSLLEVKTTSDIEKATRRIEASADGEYLLKIILEERIDITIDETPEQAQQVTVRIGDSTGKGPQGVEGRYYAYEKEDPDFFGWGFIEGVISVSVAEPENPIIDRGLAWVHSGQDPESWISTIVKKRGLVSKKEVRTAILEAKSKALETVTSLAKASGQQ